MLNILKKLTKASFIPFLLAVIILTGCDLLSGSADKKEIPPQERLPVAIDSQEVFTLKLDGKYIYAGAEKNLYRKEITDSLWTPLGLDQVKVRTFVVLSDEHYLAAYDFNNRDSLTIAQTTDGGERWRPFRNGYGRGLTRWIPSAMSKVPGSDDIIAGGPGDSMIAQSNNAGGSWELLFGKWATLGFLRFLTIDESHPDNIWTGGSTAIVFGIVVKSTDGGKTWARKDVFGSGGGNVWDLTISVNNSSHILTAQDGGILKSTDGGDQVRFVFQKGTMYTFTRSVRDPETVYVAGQLRDGSLAFFTSRDFGETWQKTSIDSGPDGIFVNDMVSVMEDGKEVLYLGTNKGMYTYGFEE